MSEYSLEGLMNRDLLREKRWIARFAVVLFAVSMVAAPVVSHAEEVNSSTESLESTSDEAASYGEMDSLDAEANLPETGDSQSADNEVPTSDTTVQAGNDDGLGVEEDSGSTDGTKDGSDTSSENSDSSDDQGDGSDEQEGSENQGGGSNDQGETETPEEPAEPTTPYDTPISAGSYIISSGLDTSKVIDVAGGSKNDGGNVQIYESNMSDAQRWTISFDEQGYYTFVNANSGLVLDVASGRKVAGTNVQQYESNGTFAQKWIIKVSGGGYLIVSALDGSLVLDVSGGISSNGTNVQVYTANGTNAQLFYFISTVIDEVKAEAIIEDGVYVVTSACGSSAAMEVGGGATGNGARVNVWSDNGTPAQHWRLEADEEGFYTITNVNSGKVLDVAGGNIVPGTKVQQYTANGSGAQKWAISIVDGQYKLVNKATGLVLDLSGARTANGTSIIGYTNNDSSAQRWLFTSCKTVENGIYVLHSALDQNKVLDVASGSKDAGANVQIYASNNTDAQRFRVTYNENTGFYTVVSVLSDKVLDINGGSTANGANVQVWNANGSNAQKWNIRADGEGYVLVSGLGSNALDVACGSSANATNVQSYLRNDTAAQRWVFDRQLTIAIEGDTGSKREVIQGIYNNGALSLFLPSYFGATNVKIAFDGTSGDAIYFKLTRDGEGTEVVQGASFDFSALIDGASAGLHTLYVTSASADGQLRTQTLRVYKSANVATVFLVSDDPENEGRAYIEASSDHSAKTTGSMLMVNADGTIVYDKALTQIKGRGNSTWSAEKKPYQIKLDKKTDLLSTGNKDNKNKTWVLLANYGDATMLHNSIAYDMGLELGMVGCEGTPVDLYYDGEYRGSYYLCEKVEIKSGRVDIHDLESDIEDANDGVDLDSLPTVQTTNKYGYAYQYVQGVKDPSDISGGYLLEIDSAYYRSEACWFETSHGVFVVKSPEFCSQNAIRYISEFVQNALNLADAGTFDISGALDLNSVAKTYLVSEFFKNIDAFCSSTYFYKDLGSDKLVCAPLWDFDASTGTRQDGGRIEFRSYEGFFAVNASWVMNNSVVQERVKSLYVGTFSSLVSDVLLGDESAVGKNGRLHSIAYYRSRIARSQQMNEQIFGTTAFVDTDALFSTYDLNVRYMIEWITNRLAWWNDNYTKLSGASVTNPTTVYNGVDYSDVYDYSYYLACNPDVAAAFGGDPEATLEHFVSYGMVEGRLSCRNFDVNTYKSLYADLRAAFGSDTAAYYRHYMAYGFSEGRLIA